MLLTSSVSGFNVVADLCLAPVVSVCVCIAFPENCPTGA